MGVALSRVIIEISAALAIQRTRTFSMESTEHIGGIIRDVRKRAAGDVARRLN